MKYLLLIFTITAMLSCSDGCEDKRDELVKMERALVLLNNEASTLYNSLVIEHENPEDVSAQQQIEDELMMKMIEIAVLEINIETYKNDYSRCL